MPAPPRDNVHDWFEQRQLEALDKQNLLLEALAKGANQTKRNSLPALPKYRSELKRLVAYEILLDPQATTSKVCRSLDAQGSVDLPALWKKKQTDRSFFGAYSQPGTRPSVEKYISKVRRDLRKAGILP